MIGNDKLVKQLGERSKRLHEMLNWNDYGDGNIPYGIESNMQQLMIAREVAREFGESYFHIAKRTGGDTTTKTFVDAPIHCKRNNHPDGHINNQIMIGYTSGEDLRFSPKPYKLFDDVSRKHTDEWNDETKSLIVSHENPLVTALAFLDGEKQELSNLCGTPAEIVYAVIPRQGIENTCYGKWYNSGPADCAFTFKLKREYME